jgi:hypothetical protein
MEDDGRSGPVCCERLVCAACGGRVTDARCGVCAASRARVHGEAALHVPDWLAVLAVLLVTVTVLLAAHT